MTEDDVSGRDIPSPDFGRCQGGPMIYGRILLGAEAEPRYGWSARPNPGTANVYRTDDEPTSLMGGTQPVKTDAVYYCDGEEYNAWAYTGKDFGCIHWQEKE